MAAENSGKEKGISAVTTFCEVLDIILGGDGVKLGHITEIVGTPGAGKTQLCLQLCASLQIFSELGGLNEEALYIDTGKNFSLSRLREVFNGTVSRIQPYVKASMKIQEAEALKRVHHVKAISMERYCSLLYTLPHYIKAHPKTKLIVIDSMAQPLKPRHSKLTSKQSVGVLFRHLADLQKIAEQNQIAVVLTNKLTTRLELTRDTYALDEAWSHRFNVRLLLSKPFRQRDSFRLATLMEDDANVVQFQSTPEGVRDVSELDTSQDYAFIMWNEHCMILCSNTGLDIHMFYTLGL